MPNLPFRRNVILGEAPNQYSITLYSIGWLSFLVKRHAQTIRKWEWAGVIPQPIFYGQVDETYRWYCAAELIGYAKIYRAIRMPSTLKDANRVKLGLDEFKLKAFEFRTKLKKEMAKGLEVMPALPNEAQLIAAVTQNRGVVNERMSRHFVSVMKSLGKINDRPKKEKV